MPAPQFSPPPLASALRAGLVSIAAQTFAGDKTFSSNVIIQGLLTLSASGVKFSDNSVQLTAALSIASSDARYVLKAGDTMTGQLNVPAVKLTSASDGLRDSSNNVRVKFIDQVGGPSNYYTAFPPNSSGAFSHVFDTSSTLSAVHSGIFAVNYLGGQKFMIMNDGSVSINAGFPSYTLDVNGTGHFASALIADASVQTPAILGPAGTTRIAIPSGGSNTYQTGAATSGSSVAHIFDTNSSTYVSGESLIQAKNNGAIKFFIDFGGTVSSNNGFFVAGAGGTATSISLRGSVADGATAIAARIGNTNALANSTAKILSLYADNFSSERFYFRQDGHFATTGVFALTSTTPLIMRGQTPDGSSAIGVQIGNSNALSTAGASICNFYSDSLATLKLSIKYDGSIVPAAPSANLGASGSGFGILYTANIYDNAATSILRLQFGVANSTLLFGNATNTSGNVAVKVSNRTNFTSAGTQIMGWYTDGGATAQAAYVAYDGSYNGLINGIGGIQVTQINPPTFSLATATTGGTLAAGTYAYRVSATTYGNLETTAATEQTIVTTGTTSTVTISWTAVLGATGYKVYGRSSGGELLITTISNPTTTSYVDTGSVTPSGALPASNNTGSIVFTNGGGRVLDSNGTTRLNLTASAQTGIRGATPNTPGNYAVQIGNSTGLTTTNGRPLGIYSDAFTTLVSFFDASGALATPAIWDTGSIARISVPASSASTYISTIAAGTGTGAHIFDTTSTLIGADRIASFRFAGSADKAYIDTNGSFWSAAGGFAAFNGNYLATGSNVAATLRGNANDGAAAIATKISNTNALTTAGAAICNFYSDNAVTLKLSINKDGGLLPADNSGNLGATGNRFTRAYLVTGITDQNGADRYQLAANSLNTYRGAVADGSTAVAHQFGNTIALANATASIANFYSDNMTSLKLSILRDGSLSPTSGANLGGTGHTFANAYIASTINDGVNVRVQYGNLSTWYYTPNSGAGSMETHAFFVSTAGALLIPGGRIASFYNDNGSVARSWIGYDGAYNGPIYAPGHIALAQAATPTGVTATGSNTGGTLFTGSYYYRVSAIGPGGTETLASAEVTGTVALSNGFGSVNVAWAPMTGAAGYKVYGRTTGAEQLIAIINDPTTVSYIDTGSIAPSGALPTSNTTGVIAGTVTIVRLSTPINVSAVQAAGTLGAGTYYYKVTAFDAAGKETLASAEVSATITATHGVKVSWGRVVGASGYNVYGRTTGAEQLIATVNGSVFLGQNNLSYTDSGAITPSGALPTSNTTGQLVFPDGSTGRTGAEALLATEPVTSCSYVPTYVSGLVTNETWSSGGLNLKTIDYTYSGSLCTQEVRKVYAADGITIVAQITIVNTYSGTTLTGSTTTRNI
jgi:hypothetical protein